MKNTLRIISILLVLVMCFSFSGCFFKKTAPVEYTITEEQWNAAFQQDNYTVRRFSYNLFSLLFNNMFDDDSNVWESIVKVDDGLICSCDQSDAADRTEELKKLYGDDVFERIPDIFTTNTGSTTLGSDNQSSSNTDTQNSAIDTGEYDTDNTDGWPTDNTDGFTTDDSTSSTDYPPDMYSLSRTVDYESIDSSDNEYVSDDL